MSSKLQRGLQAKYNLTHHLNAHARDRWRNRGRVGSGGKDSNRSATGSCHQNWSGVTGGEFDKTNQNIKMDTVHYMETKPDVMTQWN
jgi:hypothetical protein